MRSALITVVLVVLASFASAQVRISPGERSNRSAQYRQVAASYCRLDYDGARLSPEGWSRMQPTTSSRENPEFHRFLVVNRYQILPDARSEHGRIVFDVQYDVIGEYDLSGGYFANPVTVTAQIEVADLNGDTKVAATSDSRPFVGRARFQQWLQSKLSSASDPASKTVVETSIQRFTEQTKKPASQGQ